MCKYQKSSRYFLKYCFLLQVSWIRHSDLHILTVGRYTYTADNRYQSIYNPTTDEWILQVRILLLDFPNIERWFHFDIWKLQFSSDHVILFCLSPRNVAKIDNEIDLRAFIHFPKLYYEYFSLSLFSQELSSG